MCPLGILAAYAVRAAGLVLGHVDVPLGHGCSMSTDESTGVEFVDIENGLTSSAPLRDAPTANGCQSSSTASPTFLRYRIVQRAIETAESATGHHEPSRLRVVFL